MEEMAIHNPVNMDIRYNVRIDHFKSPTEQVLLNRLVS